MGVIEIIFWKVICVCVCFLCFLLFYMFRALNLYGYRCFYFLFDLILEKGRRLENDTCYAAQDRTCMTWQTKWVGLGQVNLYFLHEFFYKGSNIYLSFEKLFVIY